MSLIPNLVLMSAFLFSGFVQKWYLPLGCGTGTSGRLCIGDTDYDGYNELIFAPQASGLHYGYIYEFHPPSVWQVDSFAYGPWGPLIWALGDFDSDSLDDLLIASAVGGNPPVPVVAVLESPDFMSYPTYEVWRDTIETCDDNAYSVFDVDGDGRQEILDNHGDGVQPYEFYIRECTGNNQYEIIYATVPDTTHDGHPYSTHACGDFDGDGRNEFAMGAGSSINNFWIYESPADDTYEKVWETQLLPGNNKDCFSIADADNDGKMEFAVKGYVTPPAGDYVKIQLLEAINNNTYTIIKTFVFHTTNPYYWGGFSEAGDVNGDNIPEIVLEACQSVYIIKSAGAVGSDSFYVWHTLPGNIWGSNVRIFDLDYNGLNEIVVTGDVQTRIYEKTPTVTWLCPHPPPADTFCSLDTVTLHWQLDEIISLDSLRLYWSHPQMGCQQIYQGMPTDTLFQWVVPDTQSNIAFRIWLAVDGLGRYDSTYSPPFYVKRTTGIAEESPDNILDNISSLDVFPNPFSFKTTIRFTNGTLNQKNNESGCQKPELRIYDVTGKLVKDCAPLLNNQYNNNQIIWDGSDNEGYSPPQGVYFVHLTTKNNSTIIRKIIKLK